MHPQSVLGLKAKLQATKHKEKHYNNLIYSLFIEFSFI
jgi:hypothetical protein